MANCTSECLSRTSRCNQLLASGDASDGNINDKSAVRVTARYPQRVLGDFDNAMADWVGFASRPHVTPVSIADVRLRHGIGLDHFLPNARFEAREPLGCLLSVLFRQALCNHAHPLPRVGPESTLKICYLAQDVRGGQA